MEHGRSPDDTSPEIVESLTTVSLPTLSHVEFVAIDCTVQQERSARDIREHLAKLGWNRTDASLSHTMRKLVGQGLLECQYRQSIARGHTVTQAHYIPTKQGLVAWRSTLLFYAIRWQANQALLEKNGQGVDNASPNK